MSGLDDSRRFESSLPWQIVRSYFLSGCYPTRVSPFSISSSSGRHKDVPRSTSLVLVAKHEEGCCIIRISMPHLSASEGGTPAANRFEFVFSVSFRKIFVYLR